ncbi:MAG TPA: enoyl-CoA hydratase-related protein, partial [Thermoanaerobaculia bacterium]|nr:enoyl-CoA hydratase-related protein [Thermoanaerobaculia bacterium]
PIPRACYEVFRHVLGERGAERLAAAGDNVSVAPALELGLVDRIVAPADLSGAALSRARELAGRAPSAYTEIKTHARAQALARFDAAAGDDAFLDFWFAPEARRRIEALVERLTKKA